jgi:elongation factor Ts
MSVNATLVKELRDRTGAGMMECKRFLQETEGNIEEAIIRMREAGQAKADKKSDRTAAEGKVVTLVSDDKHSAIIIEINSETDFVGKSDDFVGFVTQIAKVALHNKAQTTDALSTMLFHGQQTVEEARQQLVVKIGENIQIRRLTLVQSEGVIGSYIHGGGQIGVLVSLKKGEETLAKDLAMQVAASKPKVVSQQQVPQALVDQERAIFMVQAKESGKPEDIMKRIVEGQVTKFLDEVALLGQPFVKNSDMKVSQLLKEKNAEVDTFIRYAVGEGIEKKESNFVEEVMAQVNQQ